MFLKELCLGAVCVCVCKCVCSTSASKRWRRPAHDLSSISDSSSSGGTLTPQQFSLILIFSPLHAHTLAWASQALTLHWLAWQWFSLSFASLRNFVSSISSSYLCCCRCCSLTIHRRPMHFSRQRLNAAILLWRRVNEQER